MEQLNEIEDGFTILELYLENLQDLYFNRSDILSFKTKYKTRICAYKEGNSLDTVLGTFDKGAKELEEIKEKEKNVKFMDENWFEFVEIVISKKANKLVPYYSMDYKQDQDDFNNFERILKYKDITWIYFKYEDKVIYGCVPYNHPNNKYYLDDEGNLHIELIRDK